MENVEECFLLQSQITLLSVIPEFIQLEIFSMIQVRCPLASFACMPFVKLFVFFS